MAEDPLSTGEIAKRLKATRKALGINQAELCRRTGIAVNTYNQWERGKGPPALKEAIKLARACGLTLDWIYFGDISALPHNLAVKIADALARVLPLIAWSGASILAA